ncbi:hypothetical protein OQ252_12585 [Acetobacter farinalis]|uniref:Uncharacterized protein n=1 Tax=Acetobacter farinalis TaxID=1260984 RepID=A0ABT3QAB3_9PROT|nr:hypothetical protein [Acetobacter farinalis]MCX2562224.1 hypothetical protein [Acetobacter farinalis]NHO30844.1 hypothetical protein [Acetobacter farinalis]
MNESDASYFGFVTKNIFPIQAEKRSGLPRAGVRERSAFPDIRKTVVRCGLSQHYKSVSFV